MEGGRERKDRLKHPKSKSHSPRSYPCVNHTELRSTINEITVRWMSKGHFSHPTSIFDINTSAIMHSVRL
jgi:hypothetical protein